MPCRSTAAATRTMNAPAGPPIWKRLPPSADTRKPPTIAVYRPRSGVVLDAIAIAIDRGNATIATVRPATISARSAASPYPSVRIVISLGVKSSRKLGRGSARTVDDSMLISTNLLCEITLLEHGASVAVSVRKGPDTIGRRTDLLLLAAHLLDPFRRRLEIERGVGAAGQRPARIGRVEEFVAQAGGALILARHAMALRAEDHVPRFGQVLGRITPPARRRQPVVATAQDQSRDRRGHRLALGRRCHRHAPHR